MAVTVTANAAFDLSQNFDFQGFNIDDAFYSHTSTDAYAVLPTQSGVQPILSLHGTNFTYTSAHGDNPQTGTITDINVGYYTYDSSGTPHFHTLFDVDGLSLSVTQAHQASNNKALALALLADQFKGADRFIGSSGNDVFQGFGGGDNYNGGAGRDTVSYSASLDSDGDGYGVIANLSHPSVNSGEDAKGDKFTSIENLIGSQFRDRLTAKGVDGQLGSTLDGQLGHDTLVASAGEDTFLFSTKFGGSNSDSIVNFAHGEDKIAIDHNIASAFTKLGAITDANFKNDPNGVAHGAQDYLVYDRTSGKLWYDADGSGTHSGPVVITTVNFYHDNAPTTHPFLNASDFLIV